MTENEHHKRIQAMAQNLIDVMGLTAALDHAYNMVTATGNADWIRVFNYIKSQEST